MKTIITIINCALFALNCMAQNKEIITIISNNDTTKMYIKNKNFVIQNKDKQGNKNAGDTTIIKIGNAGFMVIDQKNGVDLIVTDDGDTLSSNDPESAEKIEKEMEEFYKDLSDDLSETFEQIEKEFDFTFPDLDLDFNFSIDKDSINNYRYKYKYNNSEKNEDDESKDEIKKNISSKSTGNDTLNISIGKKKIIIIDENGDQQNDNNLNDEDSDESSEDNDEEKNNHIETSYLLLNIGVNTYLNNKKLDMPAGYDFLDVNLAKSFGVNLLFFETHLKLINEFVELGLGLGLDYNNYRFIQDFSLVPDTSLVLADFEDLRSFDKNKLTTKFINMPLLLQFNSNKNKHGKSFRFAGGLDVGYHLNSYTKQVYKIEGKKHIDKVHDDYNIEKLRYGAIARFGYGNINLFAKFSFTSLFEKGSAPKLNPVTVGIAILGV